MNRIAIFAAAAAALALGACSTTGTASNEAPAGRDCFNANMISSYQMLDDNRLDVRVGAGKHYYITLGPNPRDLDFTLALRLESPTSWICTGNGGGVEIVGAAPPEATLRYYATRIERGPDDNANAELGS